MTERYWEVRFRLGGGWDIVGRLLADDFADAGEKARASIRNMIDRSLIDRICAEVTELDLMTGGYKKQ